MTKLGSENLLQEQEQEILTFFFRTIEAVKRNTLTEQQVIEAARESGFKISVLWKAFAALESKGLIRCVYTNVFNNEGEPPSTVTATFRGAQTYLRSVLLDYDAVRRTVAQAIACRGDRSSSAIAHSLGVSGFIAEHFIELFRREKLVEVGGVGPLGIHIAGIASRVRWASELNPSPAETIRTELVFARGRGIDAQTP